MSQSVCTGEMASEQASRFPLLSGSKWLWNTANESDLAGNQRVGGSGQTWQSGCV